MATATPPLTTTVSSSTPLNPAFREKLTSDLSRLRAGFMRRESQTYEWRMRELKALRRMLVEGDAALSAAMWKDLRKSPFECTISEQGLVIGEIDHAMANLRDWMKPEHVPTPLLAQPGSCEIRHDAYGVTLIISAWNYPVNLLAAPLVGAICGGNAAVLKPSELAPATAQVIADLVPKYLDPQMFSVMLGGVPETQAILDEPFDLIFFTGSSPVGKIVMEKAAKNLTPVVLELGGKSPAIVMADAGIDLAAKRIAWGKFMNAGQTCIAPDYVLVHKSQHDELVKKVKMYLTEFYGNDPKNSPDYARIVNERNFDRLTKYLGDGTVACGGQSDRSERYIAPTVLTGVPKTAKVMQDEVFGPILPILAFEQVAEAIGFINSRPKPLALYLFTADSSVEEKFLDETSAGGVCLNDVVMHMPLPGLPFGGVGASGMGHYHGKFSFDTFTHAKGVLRKSVHLDVPIRYPPYTESKRRWITRLR